MTYNKTMLLRILLLESCLAVGGIMLVTIFYVYTIGQQQGIVEELFRHPFAVSNAALEFRSDVLEFRKYMLETMLSRAQFNDAQRARIRRYEDRMDNQLTVIRAEFLGDPTRVTVITREMAAWKKIREPIKAQLSAGNTGEALALAMKQASPHIEEILEETDQVIAFARLRALRFVEEGRAQSTRNRLLLVLLAGLSLTTYLLLTKKLRQAICRIYDREEHDATFDELCGAHNRRPLINLGETEIKRAWRHGLSLSVLAMDLDHFKDVNDTYGHVAGDSVLCQFSAICGQHLRRADLLGRFGGDEFVILLPHTDLGGAMHIAERIRQGVADRDFRAAEGKNLKMTVSIGVTTLDSDMATIHSLLKQADEAMYRSKSEGRNRVTAASTGGADGRRDDPGRVAAHPSR